MTTRTVAVVLTGTVTPYSAAMRMAARTTTTTASAISTAMRTASTRVAASLTSMARAAQVQAARAGSSMRALATSVAASMGSMATRSAVALRSALAPIPSMAARVSAAFSGLAARSSAAAASLSARWATAAAAVSARWPGAAARISAALTTASTLSSRAAAATSARWAAARASLATGWGIVTSGASAAATAVGVRWTAASATVSAAMTATRAAAGSAATWVGARWTAASAAVASRWVAASAVVSGAVTATRTASGRAAAWVASRWAAAGAVMSSAMLSASAAAATAGAVLATTGNRAPKALKATRSASLLLVGAFGLAAYAAANFDKAMSGVKAVTFASGKELASLRQLAITAGAATQYSATEAATAEAELAKAGVSVKDILGGGLQGTLALAAAGQLDLADAAVISAKAMNAFGLSGDQVGHVADVLAAGAGKSATDVHELGMALTQSALLAHQTGLSLEDTAGVLSLFAQNGLAGSDAGTSLKTMLMRLTPQSDQARGMMEKLGFSAYDSNGQFVGLSATAGRMRKAFSSLTPEARNAAFGVIFGSDATRAATVIYGAGASGIDKWTKAVDDQGYAAKVASTQTDNLSGDLERLKGSLETALIQSGSAANGVLRDMAKQLTGVVNWYGQLSPSVQRSVTVMSGVVGVVGLITTGVLLMLPRIIAVRRELSALGLTSARTGMLMRGLARAGVVIGVMAAMSMAADKLTSSLKKPAPDAAKLTNELVKLAQSGSKTSEGVKELDGFGDAVARIAHPSTLSRLDDIGSSFTSLGGGSKIESLRSAKEKVKALDDSLAELVQSGAADVAAKSFKTMAADAEKSGTSTAKLKTMLPKYADALAGADTQQKLAATSQKKLGDQAETTADDLQDTRTEAEKLSDALDQLNGQNISVAESEISFRQSLADLKSEVKDSGHHLDITTEKGRKVKGAFLDAAKAALAHAEAVGKQTGSVQAGDTVLTQDIAILKRQMLQMGFQKDAVDKLLSSYARVPTSVSTTVKVKDDSSSQLEKIRAKLAAVPAGKSIKVAAPSSAAIAALRAVGYKVTTLPNHTIRITVPTTGQKASLADLQRRIDQLSGKTIRITVEQKVKSGALSSQAGKNISDQSDRNANGNIYHRAYAAGGMEQHVAQIAPGGSWRLWAEPETGGESYIPLAPGKRRRSRAIAEQTVRLLGGKGIAWYAGGGVNFAGGGTTYAPSAAPTLGGDTDPMNRYNTAVDTLKSAWATLTAALKNQAAQVKQLSAAEAKQTDVRRDGARRVGQAEANLNRVRSGKHTTQQLAAAEDRLTNARAAATKANKAAAASVAKERGDVSAARSAVGKAKTAVNAGDAALGAPHGRRAPSGFDLTGYQVQLTKSVAATNAWRASLNKIGGRGGAEIQSILEGMGADGYALTQSLAKASDKQFADIAKKLLATAGIAKASLADFDRQVNASTKTSTQFASDLQKLAAEGYGDLATALAAQGDQAAQDLAHQAVGNKGAAGKANAAAKGAANALTGDDLANSITLLATLRGGANRGFADLASAGLDAATVKALAPKVLGQIKSLPQQYKAEFLRELGGQGATAMARGGILTRPTAVVAAEAGSTESWIPWNGSARSASLLSQTAAAMGYHLVPAGRWGGTGGSSSGSTHVDRSQTVHLHGADRSFGEQRADLLRHMAVLG